MAKKSKLSTPEWILEGYDSKEDWEKAKGIKEKKKKGKTYKVKECPECESRNVEIVLSGKMDSEEGSAGGTGEWECKSCEWVGEDINEKELNEEEFIEYLAETEEGIDEDFDASESKILKDIK